MEKYNIKTRWNKTVFIKITSILKDCKVCSIQGDCKVCGIQGELYVYLNCTGMFVIPSEYLYMVKGCFTIMDYLTSLFIVLDNEWRETIWIVKYTPVYVIYMIISERHCTMRQ